MRRGKGQIGTICSRGYSILPSFILLLSSSTPLLLPLPLSPYLLFTSSNIKICP